MSRPGVNRVPLSRERIFILNHPPEPLIRVRDRLSRATFIKISSIYARLTTPLERKIIEFLLLTAALLSLLCLVYVHTMFLRSSSECLAGAKGSWPREGIVRVELLPLAAQEGYNLEESYVREGWLRSHEEDQRHSYVLHSETFFMNDSPERTNIAEKETTIGMNDSYLIHGNESEEASSQELPYMSQLIFSREGAHILEFSLEHGFLKLSPEIRKKFNIPVHLVILDPDDAACFGGMLNQLVVSYVLGYDDVLLLSLKLLAEKENYKGFVRNIVTGSEYVFVNIWLDQKSYLTAAFVMLLFTSSVSILLQHSHHQIFVFIVELLHMLEFHSSIHFPAAPLLTVILALVGLEAVLSEFFQDTAAAFYVILVVWMADQYRSVCCSSPIIRKHWTRFFYLYHFFFYGYTFRFGHNLYLAFSTSWLFILHSMVYFFHRYELPRLLNRLDPNRTPNVNASNNHQEPPGNDDSAETTLSPNSGTNETASRPTNSSFPENSNHASETASNESSANGDSLESESVLEVSKFVTKNSYEDFEKYRSSLGRGQSKFPKKTCTNQLLPKGEKIMSKGDVYSPKERGALNRSLLEMNEMHTVNLASCNSKIYICDRFAPKMNQFFSQLFLPDFHSEKHLPGANRCISKAKRMKCLSILLKSNSFITEVDKILWTTLIRSNIGLHNQSNFFKTKGYLSLQQSFQVRNLYLKKKSLLFFL